MWSFLDKRFEDILGSIMLAVMVTITFLNVIVRYCTNFSFAWTEEITINFFVWVVLLGTARAFREGSNLCMNLLYDACPRTTRLFLYIVCVILCVLFFSALCWTGTLEVFDGFIPCARPCSHCWLSSAFCSAPHTLSVRANTKGQP